ncbi:MAG: hypothetical protein AAGE52_17425 [Myxococcota bacterium]
MSIRTLALMFAFLVASTASAQTVEILQFNRFADAAASIPGAFKICRHQATEDSLPVGYSVRGPGQSSTNLEAGTLAIEPFSQCVEHEFAATESPSENASLTVTLTPGAYAINEARESVTFQITSETPTAAFATAEGAARYAGSEVAENSWRGKPVFFVENLNRAGEGSLSAAWMAARSAGGGYIIPRVSGVIDASEGRLNFGGSSGIYFAGHAGPGPLLIVGADNGCVSFSGSSNLLLRYLSVLHQPPSTSASLDAVELFNATDIYVNHFDAGRGVDEAMSATVTDYRQESGRMTLDWTLYMEMDPEHTTGTLTGGLGSGNNNPDARQFRGPPAQIPALGYSYNKNLTVDISHRFPNAAGYGHWEVANNVIANHRNRWMQISYAQPRVGIRNNYIKPGPVTRGQFDTEYWVVGNRISRTAFTFDDRQMGLIFIAGTIMEGFHEDPAADNWVFNTHFFDREFLGMPVPRTQELAEMPNVYGETQFLTARDAYEQVTARNGAGNSRRLSGDGDVRVDRIAYMDELVDRVVTDRMSTSYPSRASWVTPTVPSVAPYEDSDRDGMGDAWERSVGLQVGVDDHAGRDLDRRRDNLEVFLDRVDPEPARPEEDAGQNPDAGVDPGRDAGLGADAAVNLDASSPTDAGEREVSGSGGCQTASGTNTSAFMLVLFLWIRRRTVRFEGIR